MADREQTGRIRRIRDPDEIRVAIPRGSRWLGPIVIAAVAGGGGAGGTAVWHRAFAADVPAELVQRVDTACSDTAKLKESTRALEIDQARVATRLDGLQKSLDRIEQALDSLRNRHR